ncbi:GIY-YIG nuclease family protein [Laspinema sp. D1]|uniref:GIY-YIG nuclease family protein n=1 Tax=Laspinema palackyanum D2a TaxID=2953684 RepID=A0ABT2MU48_9CYAN|nr:GIY-YIG nuclease family protein [Laspinema sp. D2a]
MLQEFITLPYLKLADRQKLPECSAIYFASAGEQILYVGLATNLRNRWQNHHRFPQLEAVNRRCEVKLFWLNCAQSQLKELERQYIEYYCPTLNQTTVPKQQIVPSFQMLTQLLKKLNQGVLGLGVCPADNQRLKTVILGYLANYGETLRATTNLRKSLQALNKNPNSLFRWTEVIRRKDCAHWRARCNGVEIRLIPWLGERIMHHTTMYEVMREKRFAGLTSIPSLEYDAMRQDVKAMSFTQRLELARSLEIGWKLFPLECGSQFRSVSGVEILCLTDTQLETLSPQHLYLKEMYPGILAINDDPVPKLLF